MTLLAATLANIDVFFFNKDHLKGLKNHHPIPGLAESKEPAPGKKSRFRTCISKKGQKIRLHASPTPGTATPLQHNNNLVLGAPNSELRKSRKSIDKTRNSGTSTTRSSPRKVGTSSRSSPPDHHHLAFELSNETLVTL